MFLECHFMSKSQSERLKAVKKLAMTEVARSERPRTPCAIRPGNETGKAGTGNWELETAKLEN